MSNQSPHQGLSSSFNGRPESLRIAAQRIDGKWLLVMWCEGVLPHKVIGHSGHERRWTKLSSALEFATRRYPSVCSFQLFWPPRWFPGKARSSRTKPVRSSSIAAPF